MVLKHEEICVNVLRNTVKQRNTLEYKAAEYKVTKKRKGIQRITVELITTEH
jgi:hypothetical protein